MHKRMRVLAAAALLTIGLAVIPVTASQGAWGTGVRVMAGSGCVTTHTMYNQNVWVCAGGYVSNVSSVWIPSNRCMYIGGYVYCAGSGGRWQGISQVKTYNVSTNVA